jgi:hypothetical protein
MSTRRPLASRTTSRKDENMAQESVVSDTIVVRVALDWRGSDLSRTRTTGPSLARLTSLRAVAAVLAQFPRLPANSVFVLYGRAHELLLPHPANPDQGTRWTPKLSGGGTLALVLARVDEPAQRVCLRYEVYPYQGPVGLDEPVSWVVADFNPTTILTGNNLYPATLADPETGELDEVPSSSPRFLTTVFRLGFHLLEQLAQQAGLTTGKLFSPRTWQAIADGDVHVVRSQYAAYLPADVRAFLQLLTVLYEQTIAHGKGIIQLATHLGLTFTRYPPTGRLTGVKLQRHQGNKLQYSFSFYDKAVQVARMRQGRTLTPVEAAMVRRHVRFDVTVHSAGVLTLVGAARRRLPRLLATRPGYLDANSARRFLTAAPQPTVWWTERAIGILALTTPPDCARRSFGAWLLPKMLREVLHLDSLAGFTAADLAAVLRQDDPVVAAWRRTECVADDWAGALAQAARCSKGWVYARRKQLLARCQIDFERRSRTGRRRDQPPLAPTGGQGVRPPAPRRGRRGRDRSRAPDVPEGCHRGEDRGACPTRRRSRDPQRCAARARRGRGPGSGAGRPAGKASPGLESLPGGARVAPRGQGAEARQAAHAKLVTKPSERHEQGAAAPVSASPSAAGVVSPRLG